MGQAGTMGITGCLMGRYKLGSRGGMDLISGYELGSGFKDCMGRDRSEEHGLEMWL